MHINCNCSLEDIQNIFAPDCGTIIMGKRFVVFLVCSAQVQGLHLFVVRGERYFLKRTGISRSDEVNL